MFSNLPYAKRRPFCSDLDVLATEYNYFIKQVSANAGKLKQT